MSEEDDPLRALGRAMWLQVEPLLLRVATLLARVLGSPPDDDL